MTVYDKGHPRGLRRLGRVEDLIQGSDGKVQGVYVRVSSKGGCVGYSGDLFSISTLRSAPSDGELTNTNPPHMQVESQRNSAESAGTTPDHASKCHPIQASTVQARDWILRCVRASAVQAQDWILGGVTD